MSVNIPTSLASGTDSRILIDAIYFVVRVLRNAGRGYGNTPVSTEPTPEARALAQRAIAEIEDSERTTIPHLDAPRLDEYISLLHDLLRQTYANELGEASERAREILADLRTTMS